MAAIPVVLVSLSGIAVAGDTVFPGAEWERATPQSQAVDPILLQQAVDHLVARGGTARVVEELVIIRNGYVIWEGPNSDNADHDLFSMSKSFASTVLGLLIDDGQVTLDTLAQDYVLNMAAQYPDVAIRQLTTHTSGYRAMEEPYPFPPGVERM
jgi:CubicO group peptidase (beta-lactamase class C family)